MALSATPNPAVLENTVTFTATVTGASGSGTPSGEVAFYDGSNLLGDGYLTGSASSDQATWSAGALTVGSHAIQAVYQGDSTHGTSSASLTESIVQATPAVTLTASPSSAAFGQSVTLTAAVVPPSMYDPNPTGTVVFFDGATSIGSATLSTTSEDVTLSVSTLSVGTHQLTARYGGDGNFNSVTTPPLTETITTDATTTSVASSSNPAPYGQPITITATVRNLSGTTAPTGTVTFSDAAGTLGTGSLSGNATSDQATLVLSNLAIGSYAITATYAGATDFGGSSSSALTQTVQQANANVSITSSANPSVAGQSVTFSVTVTSSTGVGTPTGTITLWDGLMTQLGQATLSSGHATFQVSTLAVGTNNIEPSYSGDSTFYSSSTTIQQTVNKATPSVALSTSAGSAAFGQSVTFTATITPSSPQPTGAVYFMDGTTQLASVYPSGSNQVTFTTSTLAPGSHTITAQFQGDTNYTAATSASVTETISHGNTSTALSSSQNPSTINSSVTLTATVTQAAGTTFPTGTVTFYNGSSAIGTATLSSVYGTDTASISISNLPAGVSSLTAQYGGNTDYNGSTSAVLTQTVNKVASAASLSASPNPATAGASVTLTATVTPASGFGTPPTGTVTFLNNGVSIGTGTLNIYEQASVTVAAGFTPGTFSLTVQYGGDGTYSGVTSAAVTETVNKATPTVSVASSANPSSSGQSVTFTATVTPPSGNSLKPGGTVTFYDGSTSLGTGTVNTSGQATLATSALSAGNHSITAGYGGDGNFNTATSSVLTQTVNAAATATVTLTSSSSTSQAGQSVTFTATVSGNRSTTPTGTVTFYDGSTSLGTGTVNSSGQATFTTSTLSVGTHTIKAAYSGDSTYPAANSATLTQTVTTATVTVSLTSSNDPSLVGQSVTFTATVTPPSGNSLKPSGTVTFYDGSTSLGTGTINTSGQATFATSALSAGSHSITAKYAGDSNFNTATSPVLTQTVNAAATATVTLTSSSSTSEAGQSVTFTATVSGNGSTTPTGTVTFYDGSTSLGTGTVNSSGQATFTTSTLSVGTHTIKAAYSGDSTYPAANSATLTQTVTAATVNISLTSSNNPSLVGQSVTFTAVISPTASGTPTPSGSVTFKDGSTVLATVAVTNVSGQYIATYTTSSLTLGSHTITASYNDPNYTPASQTLTQQVTNDSISILASPGNSVSSGTSVTFTVTVTPASGTVAPTGTITFEVDGTTEVTVTLVAQSNGTSTATYTTSSLSVGSHTILAVYSGDSTYLAGSASMIETVTGKGLKPPSQPITGG